jgi:dolichyl-phosphate-mannose-protein mannosyltransferase
MSQPSTRSVTEEVTAPFTSLPPVAGFAFAIAGATTLLLLLVGARYGFHRDELYFLEASKHMAWGYVDQPPLSVALIWLARHMFGESVFAIRVLPAIAAGATVSVTILLTRELGGERFPQTLAALCAAFSPLVLVAGHLSGPTVYDVLAWVVVSFLIIRILRTGKERLWLVVGVVLGVALLDKETILLLVGGLFLGFLITRQAAALRSPWLWGGAAIALIIWSPNLVWEAANGWPTMEMSRNLHADHSGLAYTLTYVPLQLLIPGIATAPVWLAGAWALWREERFHAYRGFAVGFAIVFVLIGLLMADRPYYLGGFFFVLLAAGSIVTESVVDGRRRFFSKAVPGRRVIWRSRRSAVRFVLVVGIIGLPLSLPILPASTLATVPLQTIDYNLGEMVGWPHMVGQIAAVYESLPAPERAHAAILASNYGEAGAVDRYGPAIGLPAAFSGHNTFWWWGPPPDTTTAAVVVGYDESYLHRFCSSVRPAGHLENGLDVDNDEEGEPIAVCTGLRAPWSVLWPELRHYD